MLPHTSWEINQDFTTILGQRFMGPSKPWSARKLERIIALHLTNTNQLSFLVPWKEHRTPCPCRKDECPPNFSLCRVPVPWSALPNSPSNVYHMKQMKYKKTPTKLPPGVLPGLSELRRAGHEWQAQWVIMALLLVVSTVANCQFGPCLGVCLAHEPREGSKPRAPGSAIRTHS